MQQHAKVLMICLIAAGVFVPAGCDYTDEPIVFDTMPARPIQTTVPPQAAVQPTDAAVGKRFSNSDSGTPDAVQSAVMWSDKYDEMARKYKALTEENMTLTKENNDLKKQIFTLDADLKRTRTELDDANAFLQEMHQELKQWKGDVLGFRDEIRLAQGAQLQALTQVLKLLGAETTQPMAMQTAK
ncbi:MAG: hypothetical protein IH624_00430 [Phycisphaerae bacterium]|nr:hypothetical protein [Phycisphaerae bacterium]